MKIRLTLIALAALLCTSCYPTRIVTVSSPVDNIPQYRTVVTVPKTHVSTTTTQVYAANPDISLYLDLQAVAAAFAQSSTVKDFEMLLNNSSYMISNLDLNEDGYVDYLRVMSAMQGYNHVFVIQAVLAPDIYQDVATIVAEVPSYGNYYVEVIGSPYIYGPNYVVRPVYYTRPVIFSHICRYDYRPWTSPWYWNHFPSHYRHPAPVVLNHYHAYISTYMRNHRYCHEVHYYSHCHYPDYVRLCSRYNRNDYGRQHPERSFTVRNANVAVHNSALDRGGNARTSANAYDVRMAYDATKTTSTSTTRPSSSASTTRPSGSTSSSSTRPSSSASTTRPSGSTSSSSSTRPSSSASTTRPSSSTSSSSSTRPSSSASTTRPSSSASTTSSRVKTSGSSSTRTSTTSSSGSQTTVRRGSTTSTSTTRSTGSSSSRSTSSTTRSTGSS
ncbi:MAG: hypothetical protein MSA53_05325, partial [Bacteroidales bacterium]|nr:hypothetical protein [Bacteroidales bacterium]